MGYKILKRAQELRKNMTKEERMLWYDFFKSYPVHIYRQRPFSPYIADFYCPAAKLVIEVDGAQHYDPIQAEYDQHRNLYFQKLGIQVVRFSNMEVRKNFAGVCQEIHRLIQAALAGGTSPSYNGSSPP